MRWVEEATVERMLDADEAFEEAATLGVIGPGVHIAAPFRQAPGAAGPNESVG